MKNHPLDATPDPEGDWVITTAKTQTGGDTPMMVGATPMHDADEPHYTSHFATCPNADTHRKRGK
jgi:hypothetical protein